MHVFQVLRNDLKTLQRQTVENLTKEYSKLILAMNSAKSDIISAVNDAKTQKIVEKKFLSNYQNNSLSKILTAYDNAKEIIDVCLENELTNIETFFENIIQVTL